MSTQAPITPAPLPPVVDLPIDEQWSEDQEREFDEMLTHLYYSGHDDREFWV